MSGNSISDHLVYYGVELGSDAPGSCRIVMDPRVLNLSIRDSRGNIILSRDPATPLIKFRTPEFDNQEKTISVD